MYDLILRSSKAVTTAAAFISPVPVGKIYMELLQRISACSRNPEIRARIDGWSNLAFPAIVSQWTARWTSPIVVGYSSLSSRVCFVLFGVRALEIVVLLKSSWSRLKTVKLLHQYEDFIDHLFYSDPRLMQSSLQLHYSSRT